MLFSSFTQSKVVEKIIRAKDGRLFLVRFVVSESDGVLRGRILSAAPVPELNSEPPVTIYRNKHDSCRAQRFLIPSSKKESVVEPVQNFHDTILSPFFSSLEFFVSQMTRAPSL